MKLLKKSSFPIALALAVAALPHGAEAQAAGTWVLSVELDAGSGDATFVFDVDGGEITGTYSGTFGEREVTGTVEGDTVRFAFSDDQVGRVSFTGTIDGDTMSGTCEYGGLGSGTFAGRRSG